MSAANATIAELVLAMISQFILLARCQWRLTCYYTYTLHITPVQRSHTELREVVHGEKCNRVGKAEQTPEALRKGGRPGKRLGGVREAILAIREPNRIIGNSSLVYSLTDHSQIAQGQVYDP